MQTSLPLQIYLQPYLLKAYHFKFGLNYLSSLTAIPKGNIFLFVVWGRGTWEHCGLSHLEMTKNEGLYILGPQSEITIFSTKNEALDIIGFELNPIVFHQLFRISAKSIVNQLIGLQEFLPIERSAISAPKTEERCLGQQLWVMENLIFERIQNKTASRNEVLRQAISIIEQHYGNICIKKLAEMLQMGTRSLERRFLEILGIAPKSYSKIIQFNHAFRLLEETNKKIVDIALEAGYYDQSHFVNHFR